MTRVGALLLGLSALGLWVVPGLPASWRPLGNAVDYTLLTVALGLLAADLALSVMRGRARARMARYRAASRQLHSGRHRADQQPEPGLVGRVELDAELVSEAPKLTVGVPQPRVDLDATGPIPVVTDAQRL